MTSDTPHTVPFADIKMKRRACNSCGGMMRLLCIEPDKPGSDMRTFECSKCKVLLSEIYPNDIEATAAKGWASSRLHAPR